MKQFELSKIKYRNYIEAAICSMIIDNFRGCGVDLSTITVICPFLEQANMLGEHLKPVKVLTIDKAQGIDCDIVIISCTKQTSEKGMLLRDFKRLNVAITRAKKKLILIVNYILI